MKKDLYINHWKKYLPVIRILLKKTDNGAQQLQLFKYEFEALGDRDKSGFQFNLALINGKVSNDISGSAVARNLASVLQDSPDIRLILRDKKFKINLNSEFNLVIQNL